MPPAYAQRFKWGATYENKACGVHHSSVFHLTLDEMERCGLKPLPGPTLCVVRDPQAVRRRGPRHARKPPSPTTAAHTSALMCGMRTAPLMCGASASSLRWRGGPK